jgi:2-amino-4-hydroxy-6-hydroxymethyldihydropteridine diphosphokinase
MFVSHLLFHLAQPVANLNTDIGGQTSAAERGNMGARNLDTEVALSLGSNQGDRLVHLREAGESLKSIPGFEILARSPVYETDPVGVGPEHANRMFLNAVVVGRYGGSMIDLAGALAGMERAAGRVRTTERNLPRPLDVDIIYFGNTVCSTPLQIPHPRWATRRFVVQPLFDVRPDLVLPGEKRTVREVLLSLPAVPRVVPLSRAL